MNNLSEPRVLRVPRGTPNKPPLELNMELLDTAEKRLHEVRLANPAMSKDLEGLFNEAANLATKYLAWIKYEILQAEKNYSLDRATVILEKLPEEALKLKEKGIKINEDYREALIIRDEACAKSLDILNSLKAVQALLEACSETFIRAHYSSRNKEKELAPTPNFNGIVGQTFEVPQANFMGKIGGK
jgi:hypothetical protein